LHSLHDALPITPEPEAGNQQTDSHPEDASFPGIRRVPETASGHTDCGTKEASCGSRTEDQGRNGDTNPEAARASCSADRDCFRSVSSAPAQSGLCVCAG